MTIEDGDALVTDLQSVAGDGLRSVATYDEDGYDFLYLADGLAERATELADDIHQNLVLEGISEEYLQDLFAAGELHFTLCEFEQLRAYHFVTGQFEGLFVSVDTDAAVDAAALRNVCQEHLGGS